MLTPSTTVAPFHVTVYTPKEIQVDGKTHTSMEVETKIFCQSKKQANTYFEGYPQKYMAIFANYQDDKGNELCDLIARNF